MRVQFPIPSLLLFLSLIYCLDCKYHLRDDGIGHPHGISMIDPTKMIVCNDDFFYNFSGGKALYGKVRDKFFNDGRFYGWDAQHAEKDGTVEEVRGNQCFDNEVDSDERCLKFTQTYDPEYRGRYHSEVLFSNASQHGQTAYYGFAFKLAPNWEFDDSYAKGDLMVHNRVAIAQFIAHFKDIDCGDNPKGALPTTMVWIQNDELFIRLRSGTVCTELHSSHEFLVGRLTPGKWHTLVFGVLWHKGKKGFFKVWLDEKLRVDEENLRTTVDVDDRLFQFRVGMYPNWWSYQGKGHPFVKPGLRRKRELYIDHIGYGPDFSHADVWDEQPSDSSIHTKLTYYHRFIARMQADSITYGVEPEKRLILLLKKQLDNATIGYSDRSAGPRQRHKRAKSN